MHLPWRPPAEAREHAEEENRRLIAEQELVRAEEELKRMRAMEDSRRADAEARLRAAEEAHRAELKTRRQAERRTLPGRPGEVASVPAVAGVAMLLAMVGATIVRPWCCCWC